LGAVGRLQGWGRGRLLAVGSELSSTRRKTVSPCSALALTQLLPLGERLALTFRQLWEQAASLELPQQKPMSFLSPRSRPGAPSAACCPASWARHREREARNPLRLACQRETLPVNPGELRLPAPGQDFWHLRRGREVSRQGRSLHALLEGSFRVVAVSHRSHVRSLLCSPFQVGCLAELKSPVAPADCCPAPVGRPVGRRGPGLLPHSLCYVLALTHRPGGPGRPLLRQHDVPSPACPRSDSALGP